MEPTKWQSYFARPPSKVEQVWTRLANKIKEEETNEHSQVGELRKVFSPADSVGKIEDDLREEMAKALGRTGKKVEYALEKLKAAEQRCRDVCNKSDEEKYAAIKGFNECRAFAEKCRVELVIHRQSIGLTWRNEKIVEEYYPLPPPMKF